MSRWCDCEIPKTRNLASRRCLHCGKLIRLKPKDLQIPNWKMVKDPTFNNCCLIHVGKRIMKFNPNLYWVRYAGTKKAPVVYVYASVEQEIVELLIQEICKDCKVKGCKDCLYLKAALNGDQKPIHDYLKTMQQQTEKGVERMKKKAKGVDLK